MLEARKFCNLLRRRQKFQVKSLRLETVFQVLLLDKNSYLLLCNTFLFVFCVIFVRRAKAKQVIKSALKRTAMYNRVSIICATYQHVKETAGCGVPMKRPNHTTRPISVRFATDERMEQKKAHQEQTKSVQSH